jgi:hypothetical protein
MRGIAVLILLALGLSVGLTISGRLGSPIDRPAWIGDEIAAATLLLAALAAFVALEAYRLSIQVPNLVAHLKFTYSELDTPILANAEKVPIGVPPNQLLVNRPIRRGDWTGQQGFLQARAELTIENLSEWSARNPAVRIEVEDMGNLGLSSPWQAEKRAEAPRNLYSITWEIGAAIHGKWTKNALLECFDSIWVLGKNPAIRLDVVAEQFHRVFTIPVTVVTFDEWLTLHPKLVQLWGY